MNRNISFAYTLFLLQLILIACNNQTGKHAKGDPTTAVEFDDSRMNQAISLARETLPNFKKALTNDTAAYQFSLKLKYSTSNGGQEHLDQPGKNKRRSNERGN